MPEALRERTLSIAHEYHTGITRTKALLKEKTWWPGMSEQIENLIKTCVACTSVSKPNIQPMGHNTTPLREPWEKVHIDLCGPFPNGMYIFGIIDSCSRWPELYLTKSTNTSSLIKKLLHCFSIHGFPLEIVSDNGSNLVSANMAEFCQEYNIKHKKATPLHPQANAEIERFYENVSKFVKTLNVEGRNWENELFLFLLSYRNTPHTTTGISPAKLLMNRVLRDKIPQFNTPVSSLFKKAQKHDLVQKEKYKVYYDKRKHVKIMKSKKVIMSL